MENPHDPEMHERKVHFHEVQKKKAANKILENPEEIKKLQNEGVLSKKFEPKRLNDKESGSGRIDTEKRNGAGKYNWGSSNENVDN